VKKLWRCALTVALLGVPVCAAAASSPPVSAAGVSGSGTAITPVSGTSHGDAQQKKLNQTVGTKRNAPLRLAPITVKAQARVVPERLQSDREARKSLDQTPGGVGLVTQQHIERRKASDLVDVLDFVPGVVAGTRQGAEEQSQISIRGSGLESTY
jgi:outer membrane cobalamin receptor